MPLLEVIQTRQVSASIRLTDSTATQVDQYAAFIHASADDVVEQALAYVFLKDRDFQDFLKTPQAKQASSTLRIRRAPAIDATEPPAKKPVVRSLGAEHPPCPAPHPFTFQTLERSTPSWKRRSSMPRNTATSLSLC